MQIRRSASDHWISWLWLEIRKFEKKVNKHFLPNEICDIEANEKRRSGIKAFKFKFRIPLWILYFSSSKIFYLSPNHNYIKKKIIITKIKHFWNGWTKTLCCYMKPHTGCTDFLCWVKSKHTLWFVAIIISSNLLFLCRIS